MALILFHLHLFTANIERVSQTTTSARQPRLRRRASRADARQFSISPPWPQCRPFAPGAFTFRRFGKCHGMADIMAYLRRHAMAIFRHVHAEVALMITISHDRRSYHRGDADASTPNDAPA